MNILNNIVFLITLVWSTTVVSGIFDPSDFYDCILEKMPKTKTNHKANEIYMMCKKNHPDKTNIEKRSPIFGVKTSRECIDDYGKEVTSSQGASLIRGACRKLYPRK